MNLFNIQKSFQQKKDRGWDYIYVAVDAHGTLFKPDHDSVEMYEDAIEVMRWFNSRTDFKVILWTSSHPQEIENIIEEAKKKGILFDFINENPMEKNSVKACLDHKFYFNILLEDKAGFSPEDGDWSRIKDELIRLNEW
jgi:hypothetical protein